jgi:hypothetical protein
MNTIHGIIHDLANEETIIGGCTTPGEVIIALQGLVEENNLLKRKLDKVKHAREEIVTCKNCRHNNDGICDFYQRHILNSNFYCADGKRR